jgi:hypothetical protein
VHALFLPSALISGESPATGRAGDGKGNAFGQRSLCENPDSNQNLFASKVLKASFSQDPYCLRIGYYPLKAREPDLIGWAMTNSTKLVAPLWSA